MSNNFFSWKNIPKVSALGQIPFFGNENTMAPFHPGGGDSVRVRISNVSSVDELIDVVNALQNKLAASGHHLDINLPQIAVIGCQSAGKSSVLERFVGKEFLPRGPNLLTRRPIIVQLIPSDEEYGVFLHKEDEQFRDFGAIRDEIIKVTNEECGPKEFSKKPICLSIYSPKVLKLTLVDLPGIVKVPVKGQTSETVSIVEDIVTEYIKNDKTIILAVTPMSQDIANSDALAISRKVDPDGERTIGVLTKLDLEGVDARDVLDNTHVHLKRGWVGVVNRNAKEIEEGKDMDYITRKEADFFQNNELYYHMASRMGIPYLQKLLQKTLRSHIKQSLPDVRNEIAAKLARFEKELREFESVIGDGANAKQLYMVRLIQKFSDDIKVKIMGYSEIVLTNTLTHGAIMNFKLHTEVQRIISQALVPNEEEITKLIPNINGIRNSISIPSLAIDSVCRTLIDRFRAPLDLSVMCIKDCLLDAVADSSKLLDTCPSLKHEVMYQIKQWIDKESENTKDRLQFHIDTETFYINTGHPDFDSATFDPVAPTAGPVKIWKDFDFNKNSEDDGDTFSKLLSANDLMQKQVKVLDAISQDLVPTVLDAANFSSVTEDCDEEIRRKEEMINTCNILKEALDAIKAF